MKLFFKLFCLINQKWGTTRDLSFQLMDNRMKLLSINANWDYITFFFKIHKVMMLFSGMMNFISSLAV